MPNTHCHFEKVASHSKGASNCTSNSRKTEIHKLNYHKNLIYLCFSHDHEIQDHEADSHLQQK